MKNVCPEVPKEAAGPQALGIVLPLLITACASHAPAGGRRQEAGGLGL